MINSKDNQERIEKLPSIFKERINRISITDPKILNFEIEFCEQAVTIISYVEKRIIGEFLNSPLTSDEYQATFPLREEIILWQFPFEMQARNIPDFPEKLHWFSLMLARLYFSDHQNDIVTLMPGIVFFNSF